MSLNQSVLGQSLSSSRFVIIKKVFVLAVYFTRRLKSSNYVCYCRLTINLEIPSIDFASLCPAMKEPVTSIPCAPLPVSHRSQAPLGHKGNVDHLHVSTPSLINLSYHTFDCGSLHLLLLFNLIDILTVPSFFPASRLSAFSLVRVLLDPLEPLSLLGVPPSW